MAKVKIQQNQTCICPKSLLWITEGIFKPVFVTSRYEGVVPKLKALDADEVEGNLVSKLLYVLGSVFQVSIFMKTFYGWNIIDSFHKCIYLGIGKFILRIRFTWAKAKAMNPKIPSLPTT